METSKNLDEVSACLVCSSYLDFTNTFGFPILAVVELVLVMELGVYVKFEERER